MPSRTFNDTDGRTLTVSFENMLGAKDDRLDDLGESVWEIYKSSKECVRLCQRNFKLDENRSAKARWGDVADLVKKYFGRTPAEMTQGQRSTMRLVLRKTQEGFEKDFDIVVNAKLGAAGAVSKTPYAGDLPDDPIKKAKAMEAKGVTTSMAPPKWEVDTFKKEYILKTRGSIHINLDWVDDQAKSYDWQHSCVTLIHEATHKFANTWDYCYFNHGGTSVKTPECGRFDATDKDNLFAHHGAMDVMTRHFVGNADSYGYFMYFARDRL